MNEGRSPPHCLREAEAETTVKGSDPEARAFASAALQAVRCGSNKCAGHHRLTRNSALYCCMNCNVIHMHVDLSLHLHNSGHYNGTMQFQMISSNKMATLATAAFFYVFHKCSHALLGFYAFLQ